MAMTTSNSIRVKARLVPRWSDAVDGGTRGIIDGDSVSRSPDSQRQRRGRPPAAHPDVAAARSAFGLRWQALRKGATPLSKPDPTVGLAGPRRTAAWRRCAPSRRTPKALRAGNRRDLSSARSAFGLRWQALRKGATPLSKPDPTAGLAGPRRKAEWASLKLLPSALHGAPRGEPPRPVFRAQRFRTAVARPSEGRDTAMRPDATVGLVGSGRTAAWRR